MKIVFSERHCLHRVEKEMYRGEWVPCLEKPERADYVHQSLQAHGIGPTLASEIGEKVAQVLRDFESAKG